jgi:hypothetical protein
MPSEPQNEVARARDLKGLLSSIVTAMDEFDPTFKRFLEGALRASQINEVEELHAKLDKSIKTLESCAAILSSPPQEVWVVYDSAYSHELLMFDVMMVSRGKTPEEDLYRKGPALRASDFRKLVEALLDDLRRGLLTRSLLIPAHELIGYHMSSTRSSG